MTALPVKKQSTDNVIELRVVNGSIEKKPKVRYTKDGSVDKRYGNSVSVAGVSKEVYPLYSKDEIKSMIGLFNKRIEEAENDNQRQIACRNKMMFLIGINIGIRASDLCNLRYNFFMNDDGTFKDGYKLQPKKTRKTGKFVPLYFNQTVKKAITDYVKEYPIESLDDYLFKSRKGSNPISEKTLWDIMNKAGIEAGIKQNLGSHSLRKTFGRFIYHNSEDKNNSLVILQTIFNHSSPAVTSKYIGLTDDEVCSVFNSLDLGLEYI